jgi:hypothetical protein
MGFAVFGFWALIVIGVFGYYEIQQKVCSQKLWWLLFIITVILSGTCHLY